MAENTNPQPEVEWSEQYGVASAKFLGGFIVANVSYGSKGYELTISGAGTYRHPTLIQGQDNAKQIAVLKVRAMVRAEAKRLGLIQE